MKKVVCLLTVLCLLSLCGCDALSLTVADPELDRAVASMFTALARGDEETQRSLFRSDAELQENVAVEGEIADLQPLNRHVEISDGVTRKDARYQVETADGDKYVVLVRYIIDSGEEGFYQYTVAKK